MDFFQEFIEDFETDDNFLLVAIENKPDVFQADFLSEVDRFVDSCYTIPHIVGAQSLTNFKYPIKTPFGINAIKALRYSDSLKLALDKDRILQDERFVYNLINEDGTALLIFLKTEDQIGMDESAALMQTMNRIVDDFVFDDIHFLGRSFFQNELAWMQKREVIVSTGMGALLVGFILILIFRRRTPILIALGSIGIGLIIFFGVLSAFGRELNAIAAFYPVLMLIVGTSDIIHIMSKYMDELKKGVANDPAIVTTIKEIGLATFLTSITTSAGFLSLLTSRLTPIRDFGINSAIGVMIAFICVILFSCSVMSLVPKEKLIREKSDTDWLSNSLNWVREFTLRKGNSIVLGFVLFLGICFFGISKISTNYTIEGNLPTGTKLTADFLFFQDEFAGFRPYEFILSIDENYTIDDYEVVASVDKLESYLKTIPEVKAIMSISGIYKSINQMLNGNKIDAYRFPSDSVEYKKAKKYTSKMPKQVTANLISKDLRKTRITSRIRDIGADDIKVISDNIDKWVKENIDDNVVSVRRTGTGMIMDKNSIYVRDNLLQGLGLALLVISIMMALLFRNWRMLFISLVPNILPLLFAAAILGYFGIELEAVLSIVFALIFGIAVDDTIHFLSKYKLAFEKSRDKEAALDVTFRETGKAIFLTTVILFFGFLIMLFSIHPPSVIIGTLIAVTLVSALIIDLLILPILIRKFL